MHSHTRYGTFKVERAYAEKGNVSVKENIARLPTATPRGLHEFVAAKVLARYARSGVRAADLGAGPGAMSQRLGELGCTVGAVDRAPDVYKAGFPFVTLDLNEPAFPTQLRITPFAFI